MSMGATIVTYTVAAANADELRKNVEEYLVPAARSAQGYRGFLLLDQGEGQRTAMLLFESADEARAAQAILGPVGAQYTYSLMSSPAIGALGTVLVSDGIFTS